jgi:thiamine biosynthesis lipoprotein
MISRLVPGLVISAMVLLVSGCARKTDVFESRLNILGTFAQVSIAGLAPEQAQDAAQKTEQSLKSLDHIGYTFDTGGELQRVNEALANGRTIAVSDEMIELLTKARELSLASGGLFNPAAGELTALWEFHCDRKECDAPPPYPGEVRKLVEQKLARVLERAPSMDDVTIRGNRVGSRNRQVRLEFGDIIRGLALDMGVATLHQAGADNAMIDIGGSVHTTGTRGDHAWWIGIPDASGKRLVGSVESTDVESIVTVRALDISPGKQDFIYRRIVDPRTGLPAEEIRSVTVIHPSAMVANAAAVSFLIAGTRDWKTAADRIGVHAVLMITQDGTIYTSPAIDNRIQWKQGITHQHLVP